MIKKDTAEPCTSFRDSHSYCWPFQTSQACVLTQNNAAWTVCHARCSKPIRKKGHIWHLKPSPDAPGTLASRSYDCNPAPAKIPAQPKQYIFMICYRRKPQQSFSCESHVYASILKSYKQLPRLYTIVHSCGPGSHVLADTRPVLAGVPFQPYPHGSEKKKENNISIIGKLIMTARHLSTGLQASRVSTQTGSQLKSC